MVSRWCMLGLLATTLAWGQAPVSNDHRTPGPRREPAPVEPDPLLDTRPVVRAPGANRPEEELPPFTNYRLGSQDLVAITVLDSPEFSRQVRVTGEGTIRLPLVKQSITASGKTAFELEQALARILVEEGLLREPTVAVTVREFHSKPISVTGAVRQPSVFQAARPVTLLEALTRSGGVMETAGPEALITIPAADGQPARSVRVSMLKLLRLADPEANIILHGGEEVRVLPAAKIYVIGGVTKPGPVLISDDQPLTLLQAVAQAGGPMPTAASRGYLLRAQGDKSQRQEIAFNLKKLMKSGEADMVLQPDDLVFVPDSTAKRITQGGVMSAVTSLGYTAMGALLWR